MNAAKRLEIFRRLHEDNPDPKTELAYTTPFELLVAVTLSAQSTDVGVNKATARLFPVANTPRGHLCPGRRRPQRIHKDHWAVQQQGQERHRSLPLTDRASR